MPNIQLTSEKLDTRHNDGISSRRSVTRHRTRIRALQACQQCAATKTRCDNDSPCQRCARRGLRCVRDIDISDQMTADVRMNTEEESPHVFGTSPGCRPRSGAEVPGVSQITPSASLGGPHSTDTISTLVPTPSRLDTFQTLSSELDVPHGNRDQSGSRHEHNDLCLTTQDAEFLSAFPDMFLGTESDDYPFTTTYAQDEFGVSDWISAAGSSSEQTQAGQAPPIVPSAVPSPSPPRAETTTDPDPFRLDLSARDHLLAFAVDACEPETLTAVVSAFPTCEGLATLARAFMGWHAEQEDTFVHGPTFVAAQVRTELLMAVVAGGAVRSASPAVQRFGFALHRVLGTQLARLVRSTIPFCLVESV